jgi:hypothetical protein
VVIEVVIYYLELAEKNKKDVSQMSYARMSRRLNGVNLAFSQTFGAVALTEMKRTQIKSPDR